MTKVYDKSGKKVNPVTIFTFKVTAVNRKTKKVRTVRTGLSLAEATKFLKGLAKENKKEYSNQLALGTDSHTYYIEIASVKK